MALSENELYIQSVIKRVGREDIRDDEIINEYNRWAETYDEDIVGKLGYSAHVTVSSTLCELFQPECRSQIRILDAGAGTGLLGEKLKEYGFTLVDALDPSRDMLEVARKKDVYTNYYCEYMTGSPLDMEKGTYDVLVGIGMLGHKHAPFTAMHEMARLTKPGGYVILAVRRQLFKTYEEYRDLEPTMEQLESSGKWTKVSKTVFPNYLQNCDGLLYVFRICHIQSKPNSYLPSNVTI